MTAIKQGDSYYLSVSITLDEERLDIEMVECVEFYLNGRRKLWPDNVVYVQKTDTFQIHLTQEETFSWTQSTFIPLDIRLKFTSGDVIGLPKPLSINVSRALSKEVL